MPHGKVEKIGIGPMTVSSNEQGSVDIALIMDDAFYFNLHPLKDLLKYVKKRTIE